MAHELEKPTDYVQGNGVLVHSCGVLGAQRIAEGCGGEADYGEDGAGYRLQKNVEPTPRKSCQGAKVKVEVRDCEPVR